MSKHGYAGDPEMNQKEREQECSQATPLRTPRGFDEWWKQLDELCKIPGTKPEYFSARAAWNAALTEAEKVAHETGQPPHGVDPTSTGGLIRVGTTVVIVDAIRTLRTDGGK